MSKQNILTDLAPLPIGPYSQAIRAGAFLFVSGNIALDPKTGEMVNDSLEAETTRVMSNIAEVLKAAGVQFSHVVKTSIFLTDMNSFQTVNGIYEKYFDACPPARETVEVSALPRNARIEISMVAYTPQ